MGLILADTNIVIYILKGLPVMKPYLSYHFALSDISVIELLGVKNLDAFSKAQRQAFIDCSITLPISQEIRNAAILLKQKYHIRTPDALKAAKAQHHNISLITADKDFLKIKESPILLIDHC